MSDISNSVDLIRNAVNGIDVREGIASGMEIINDAMQSTNDKQAILEEKFDDLIADAGNSNAEIVAGRRDNVTGIGYNTIGARLDKYSTDITTLQKKTSLFTKGFSSSLSVGGWKSYGYTNDEETVKAKIDNLVANGVKYVNLAINTSKKADGTYAVSHDLDKVLSYIQYGISKGLVFYQFKLHCNEFRGSFMSSTADKQALSTQWMQIMDLVGNKFKGYIETMGVMNEGDNLYYDVSTASYVVQWLKKGKSLGYKCSITTNSVASFLKVHSSILSECDFYCTNYYPRIGTKGLSTPLNDFIRGISAGGIQKFLSKGVQDNKACYVTETGCSDIEKSLLEPWIWAWSTSDTLNDGQVQAKFLEGIFNFYQHTTVTMVTWWYDFNGATYTKAMIEKYTGGDE